MEGMKMTMRRVFLQKIEDGTEMAIKAGNAGFPVKFGYENTLVSASSIVGVWGKGLFRPITLMYDGRDEALEQFIVRHEMAG